MLRVDVEQEPVDRAFDRAHDLAPQRADRHRELPAAARQQAFADCQHGMADLPTAGVDDQVFDGADRVAPAVVDGGTEQVGSAVAAVAGDGRAGQCGCGLFDAHGAFRIARLLRMRRRHEDGHDASPGQ
nr:hypothetical protein [Methylibium sp.]